MKIPRIKCNKINNTQTRQNTTAAALVLDSSWFNLETNGDNSLLNRFSD